MEPDINKIEAFSSGDLGAFRSIMDASKDMVYNTALGIVKDETDAEDIAQDVFVKLFENAKDFRGDAKLTTWLYRVTVNTSLDHYRRKNGKKRLAYFRDLFSNRIQPQPAFDHPGIRLENKDHARALFAALDKLPVNQQVVFVLFHMEGKTYREIAEIVERSTEAVESLMARAKGNLQNLLKSYFDKQIMK